jgi:hypothetical protein
VVRPLGAPEWQEGGGFEFARVEKNPKKTLDACLNRARIRHIIEGKGEGHTGSRPLWRVWQPAAKQALSGMSSGGCMR